MRRPAANEIPRDTLVSAVDAVIASRRTVKIFGDPDAPSEIPAEFMGELEPALAVAGMAPFHYACHGSHRDAADESGAAIEPWRIHLLDHPSCRALVERIRIEAERSTDAIWQEAFQSKIPRMLSSAGALALLCWLPDPPLDGDDVRREAERAKRNREHLAATAAFGQNLLLAATARGLASYWSSGGVLATDRALEICGVPAGQALLGAMFFFPEPGPEASFVTGKLRDRRSPVEAWCRRVRLDLPGDEA